MLKAIDFFCGGGGMTCGLRQAGVNVIAGVDIDGDAKETYEFNNSGSTFIQRDIKELEEAFFEKKFNVERHDDSLILVGCSPCQYYSIINTDKKKSEKSKDLLADFVRFVEYYMPGFVLVENVPGIMTNGNSVLPYFVDKLKELGYGNSCYKVVNMSRYGVPQTRKRFSLIASRIKNLEIKLPDEDDKVAVLKDFIGVDNGFYKVSAGYKDTTDFNHTVAGLSEISLQRISKTHHNGGSRIDWADDEKLQLPCFVGKDNSFKDTFGRMSWDKPASTVTTKFFSISNGRFGHPEEDRALSLREGATLQTFPKDYVFKTKSIAATAKLIGNAVPPEYARRIGRLIADSYGR